MCQVEGKTEVEGFLAFHIQRHPPIPPGQPAKDGQEHLEAAAQVQGVGVGPAAECPRTKTPPEASSEVTCCLQGRLRRTGEGTWRKWCCSLGNQFVPPLIGRFALPLWDSGQWASRSLHNSSGRGGRFASPCSFKQPVPHTNLFCSRPCFTSLFSLFGLSRPSLYPSSFHNEAGSGTFPHSLTLKFLFSQWPGLHFTPAPCLPVSSGLGPFSFHSFRFSLLGSSRRPGLPESDLLPTLQPPWGGRKKPPPNEWPVRRFLICLELQEKSLWAAALPHHIWKPPGLPGGCCHLSIPGQVHGQNGRRGLNTLLCEVCLCDLEERLCQLDSILWLFAGYRCEKFGTWAGSESELSPWQSWFAVSLLMAKLSLSLGEMSPCCPRHSPFKESPFKSFAHLTCGFTSRCISLHFRYRLYF